MSVVTAYMTAVTAYLVSVVQELDLGVTGSESPHQASSVPSGPLNTTFDPDTRHLST